MLVSFKSHKSDVHYMGKVMSIRNNEYEIKYLRRRGNSNYFVFPDIDDWSLVNKEDIVAIVPCFDEKRTLRTSSVFKFNFNFDSIKVR